MFGRLVITAHLCVGQSPCIACCIARSFLLSSHVKKGFNCRQCSTGAEMLCGHFGTSAELSGQFQPVSMVPVSWARTVFGPKCLYSVHPRRWVALQYGSARTLYTFKIKICWSLVKCGHVNVWICGFSNGFG